MNNLAIANMQTTAKILDGNYWDNRYENDDAVWDLGTISPPIRAYIDQLTDKNVRVLIMGCGNAHEAEYLVESGFTNITLIDIAPTLVENLKQKFASKPQVEVILGDFFELNQPFDLVLEQTLFCAIDPKLRPDYVQKMKEIVVSHGKIVGVMFSKIFEFDGPPFGGTKEEYTQYFELYFDIKTLDDCYNSAEKRQGIEVFINFVRKTS